MTRFYRWIATATVLALVSGIGTGKARADDVQVNTYTTGDQRRPSVAVTADGDFVVAWTSYGSSGTDASGTSVQGQRFAANGSAVGDQFQINTYTTGYQTRVAVATHTFGDFVVVWHGEGSGSTDNSGRSIQGQRFASTGSALGGEFQVNTYTAGDQSFPAVAMAADGDFVVVWSSAGSSGSDVSGSSIQGQRYASDGTPVAGEFQINTYTTSAQIRTSVATNADGEFIVAWTSYGSAGTDLDASSVQAQRYASDGSLVGAQFQVNTSTLEAQYGPSVALSTAGEFVVVWTTYFFDNGYTYLRTYGQRFASNGSPAGGELLVNGANSESPTVTLGASGEFTVVWSTYDTPVDIEGRRFAADGSFVGGIFQINTYATGYQYNPAAALGASGDFVVVWDSSTSGGTDSDGYSIQRARNELLFSDGFETGDTSLWSGTTP